MNLESLSAQERGLPECPNLSLVSEPRNISNGTWVYIQKEPSRYHIDPPSYGRIVGSLDAQVSNVSFVFNGMWLESSNPSLLTAHKIHTAIKTEFVTSEQKALQAIKLESVYVGTIDFATVLKIFKGLPSRNNAQLNIEIRIDGEPYYYSETAGPRDKPENLNFPRINSFFSDQQWHVVLHPNIEIGHKIASYLLDGGRPQGVEFIVRAEGSSEVLMSYNLDSFVTGDALQELISGEPHPLSISEKFITEFYRILKISRNHECQRPDHWKTDMEVDWR